VDDGFSGAMDAVNQTEAFDVERWVPSLQYVYWWWIGGELLVMSWRLYLPRSKSCDDEIIPLTKGSRLVYDYKPFLKLDEYNSAFPHEQCKIVFGPELLCWWLDCNRLYYFQGGENY